LYIQSVNIPLPLFPLFAYNLLSLLQNVVNLYAYIHCNKWQWYHRALNCLGNKNNSQHSDWLSSTDFIGLVWLLLPTNKKWSNSYFLLDVLVHFCLGSFSLPTKDGIFILHAIPPKQVLLVGYESLKHLQLIQLHWII
jgi:hypothetical protein